jgi:hypothetical protein
MANYAMDGILKSPNDNNFGTIAIDKKMEQNGFQPIENGFGFNESTNIFKKITGPDTKLPISNVRTVAIDTRNQLWIGTTKGLRVLPNIGNFKRKTK